MNDEIRSQFPALARLENGHPVAYFDAPGGTQVPRVVAEAMMSYLFAHNANTHWAYPTSAETDAIIAASREAVADFLNCAPGEVVFGNNMTSLTFHVARTLGRTWSAGDEVIVTELDHHANVDPWRALERDFGIVIKAARFHRDTTQLDYEHLASLVTPRTKVIAVGGASNATGTVNDLERVRAIATAANALLFVDAVHLAPHELIDVKKIGCDFLACSSYKFYGPHAGILFAKSELLASLPFPKLAPSPDYAPERAELGTQNHEAIAGIGATIEFLASIGGAEGTRRERLTRAFHALHAAGLRYAEAMWRAFSSTPGVHVYGPPPDQPRTPTIAFTVDGISAEDVVRKLADEGLFASHGNFYAQTAVERLACGEFVRVGCACYTTDAEVERLIGAVSTIARA